MILFGPHPGRKWHLAFLASFVLMAGCTASDSSSPADERSDDAGQLNPDRGETSMASNETGEQEESAGNGTSAPPDVSANQNQTNENDTAADGRSAPADVVVNITNSGNTDLLLDFELRGPTRLIYEWSGTIHSGNTFSFERTLELGGEHTISLSNRLGAGSTKSDFDPDHCRHIDLLHADFEATLERIDLKGPDCSTA